MGLQQSPYRTSPSGRSRFRSPRILKIGFVLDRPYMSIQSIQSRLKHLLPQSIVAQTANDGVPVLMKRGNLLLIKQTVAET